MKKLFVITLFTMLAISNAWAEMDAPRIRPEEYTMMHKHQKAMVDQMKTMQARLKEVAGAKGRAKQKAAANAHIRSLQKGTDMLQEMMEDRRRKNIECMEKERTDPDTQTCYEPETHQDTFTNMMLLMFEQLLEQQLLLNQ